MNTETLNEIYKTTTEELTEAISEQKLEIREIKQMFETKCKHRIKEEINKTSVGEPNENKVDEIFKQIRKIQRENLEKKQ